MDWLSRLRFDTRVIDRLIERLANEAGYLSRSLHRTMSSYRICASSTPSRIDGGAHLAPSSRFSHF